MSRQKLILPSDWNLHLEEELNLPYMTELFEYLKSELAQGKTIYPKMEDVFSSFEATPFNKVKVVVLGQDPYHGEGQAHGLSFSVQKGMRPPPSLKNIFNELKSDLGIEPPEHGCLQSWAKEGVLLLNNVLTVEASKAGSHQKKGWEQFTQKVIEVLNVEKENLVFILWGSPAQKKASVVDSKKHFLIKSVHPSPLSSYRGFFGSKPFSQANDYLESKGITKISWNLN